MHLFESRYLKLGVKPYFCSKYHHPLLNTFNMDTPRSTKLYDFLFMLGITGAILGAASDVLLLYLPDADYLDGTYSFLTEVPESGLMWGHFLGIFAIPLTLAGYRVVCHALEPMGGNVAWGVFGIAVFIFFSGVCYHSGFAYMAHTLKSGGTIENLLPYWEPLAKVTFFGFATLSLTLMVLIFSLKTRYTRWVGLFNPLFIYLFCILAYYILPKVGGVLLVAGFNLSNAVFLFISWIVLRDRALI